MMIQVDSGVDMGIRDPILRMPAVEDETGYKRSTIYLLIKRGEFPAPIKIGARASGWLLSQINAWKRERIAITREGVKSCR